MVNMKRFNHTPASGSYGDRLWVEDPSQELVERLNKLSMWGGYDKSGPDYNSNRRWEAAKWKAWEFGTTRYQEALLVLKQHGYTLTTDIGWLND